MTVSTRTKNRLPAESALQPFACLLFLLRAAFACAAKSPVAASFESAVYAFSRAALRAASALSNALLCARRALFCAAEGNAITAFACRKIAVLRSQEKNENKKQEQRKEAKEVKKKEIEKEKNPPFIFPPPRGGRAGTIYIGGDFLKPVKECLISRLRHKGEVAFLLTKYAQDTLALTGLP